MAGGEGAVVGRPGAGRRSAGLHQQAHRLLQLRPLPPPAPAPGRPSTHTHTRSRRPCTCSVEMMSSVLNMVMSLRSLMEMEASLDWRRICGRQRARQGTRQGAGARWAGGQGWAAVTAGGAGVPGSTAARWLPPGCCWALQPCDWPGARPPPGACPATAATHVEQHAGPVGAVGDEAQVGQRALGGAHLALNLAELVGEGDEELAVALQAGGRWRRGEARG